MRIGFNPHKDVGIKPSAYQHQVVIPVYIPNQEGYFKDSFVIFQRCIRSLLATVHDQTFVTIVNNGSDKFVREYLDALLAEGRIHEVIHTENIGKANAIIKGLSGNGIPLLTISDADVLFCSGWQKATYDIFQSFPKAGVVGVVPQFKVLNYRCENLIAAHFFDSRLRFVRVKDPASIQHFHQSIGWKPIDAELLERSLAIQAADGTDALVGTGHFMATYRKAIFDEIQTYQRYLLGGNTEGYLDGLAVKKDLWRLTTTENYAFHMGNIDEPWMEEIRWAQKPQVPSLQLAPVRNANVVWLFFVNKIFKRLLANTYFKRKVFYRFKKLPAHLATKY
ncbi:glycosyltransferase family A protein [Flavobacterium caeni]|uniref:Glycosyl transferase family 2 n=1 Tax=Flavobacterium caeni TaxID=490189 RepID=A0A1G5FKX8_9FLAO|nr:glycosyltransferase family A protein [Flavobacterium caeni]SCY39801.1 Glycosyl transferase family 2 [Flavobacterium caeni]